MILVSLGFLSYGFPLSLQNGDKDKFKRRDYKFTKLKNIMPIGSEEMDFREGLVYDPYVKGFDSNFWNEISNKGIKDKINIKLIDIPINIKNEKLSSYSCAGALNLCEIHSDGTISPCTLCRVCIPEKFMKFENIKEKSLKEIWEGNIFNQFRSYMDIGCNGCKMLPKCNKCIAQSFRYFSNGESPTPFCIKNGEELGIKDIDRYKQKLNEKFNISLK